MKYEVTSEEINIFSKVTWSRYRPGVAQREVRGMIYDIWYDIFNCNWVDTRWQQYSTHWHIALLFHDRGTRRGWVVSSTSRPHFTPGRDPVPIVQEAGWAPGRKISSPPGFDPEPSSPCQSLYRLSYPAHKYMQYLHIIKILYKTNKVKTVLMLI